MLTTTTQIQEIEDQYTSGLYTKRPLAIVRGLGAHVWDADGNEYIDCVGGQGAANIGHANPQVVQAIAAQAATSAIAWAASVVRRWSVAMPPARSPLSVVPPCLSIAHPHYRHGPRRAPRAPSPNDLNRQPGTGRRKGAPVRLAKDRCGAP